MIMNVKMRHSKFKTFSLCCFYQHYSSTFFDSFHVLAALKFVENNRRTTLMSSANAINHDFQMPPLTISGIRYKSSNRKMVFYFS